MESVARNKVSKKVLIILTIGIVLLVISIISYSFFSNRLSENEAIASKAINAYATEILKSPKGINVYKVIMTQDLNNAVVVIDYTTSNNYGGEERVKRIIFYSKTDGLYDRMYHDTPDFNKESSQKVAEMAFESYSNGEGFIYIEAKKIQKKLSQALK